MISMNNKAVFLDRDGTLIEDRGYICDFSQAVLFPYSIDAVRLMNENGFKVIVVTNQSAVARGICSESQVQQMHNKIKRFFADRHAVIDAFYYSPFHEEGTLEKYRKKHESRKPRPGMILQAADDFSVDLSRSFVIGDSTCDIMAGQNAGCKTILVLSGKNPRQTRQELRQNNVKPDLVVDNLLAAAREIMKFIQPAQPLIVF